MFSTVTRGSVALLQGKDVLDGDNRIPRVVVGSYTPEDGDYAFQVGVACFLVSTGVRVSRVRGRGCI